MGGIEDPQPVRIGLLCEEAGADELSFRIHREDEYQVVRDVEMMRELTQCSVALRLSPHGELLKLAFEAKPDRVILVPERATGATVDTGFDLGQSRDTLKKRYRPYERPRFRSRFLLMRTSTRYALRTGWSSLLWISISVA